MALYLPFDDEWLIVGMCQDQESVLWTEPRISVSSFKEAT